MSALQQPLVNPSPPLYQANDFSYGKEISCTDFSTISIVRHKSTFEKYAWKVPQPHEIAQRHFHAEYKLMTELDHPYCMSVKGTLIAKKKQGMLMALKSSDLFTLIETKRLAERELKSIMHNLVSAVAYLHRNKILHRDIKPENIFLDTDGASLGDFGLAVRIDQPCKEPAGSLAYVAPEVLNKQPYSFPADIWSVGVVMYACLIGDVPYHPLVSKPIATVVSASQLISYQTMPPSLDLGDVKRGLYLDAFLNSPCKQLYTNHSHMPLTLSDKASTSMEALFLEHPSVVIEVLDHCTGRYHYQRATSSTFLVPGTSSWYKYHHSKTGRDYYYKPSNKTLSWVLPTELQTVIRPHPVGFKPMFPRNLASADAKHLLRSMLTYNPDKRITAEQILKSSWFK